MKKVLKWLVAIAIAALAIFGIIMDLNKVDNTDFYSASYNGWLRVDGNRLVNQRGKELQLIGISSHGIQWFNDLYTKDNIAKLKSEFGANIFRVAMYVDESDDGYVKNQELKEQLTKIVDDCIALDMYVIIDWHILKDNNPQTHKSEAIAFFSEMAERYAKNPNVIYEICNEPNGDDVKWSSDIRPYAQEVVSAIRERSPDSIIIVGTPRWSTELAAIVNEPVDSHNIMYAIHFYAGSHNQSLRDKIDSFRDQNLAVFVSECGMTDATGDGDIYEEKFDRWMDYLKDRKISWLYWSFSDKDESSALLKEEFKLGDDFMEYLTPGAEHLKTIMKEWYN